MRISAHLSGCASCSGVSSGLTAISRLLAGTPAATMPESVVTRIQVAIATESADRAARQAGHPAPAQPAARHLRAPRARRPVWSSPVLVRGLAAAAAVLIVAGGGYLFARSTSGPASTTGAPGAAPSGRSLRTGAPVANGVGTIGIVRVPYRRAQASAPVLASELNYTPLNLATQVRRLVATARAQLTTLVSPQASPNKHSAQFGGSSLPARVLPLSRLSGCLTQVAGAQRVLAVSVARYLGEPATIIVLMPLRAAARIFDVVIVGGACSAATPDVIIRTTVPAR